jgi:hypothetical protein
MEKSQIRDREKHRDADPGSGMEKILIRDGKKSDRGSGKTSRIRTTASKTLFLFQ